MVDDVIVTVVYRSYQFDMEIPANTSVEKIMPGLRAALQSKGISLGDSFILTCRGRTLAPSDTLFRAGVWDGSYLEVHDRS